MNIAAVDEYGREFDKVTYRRRVQAGVNNAPIALLR